MVAQQRVQYACGLCHDEPRGQRVGEHLTWVPDRFPLVVGHRLLVTRSHQLSIGQSPTRCQQELRNELERISQDGDFVAFEHGPLRPGSAGSCVDHAHVHVLPFHPALTAVGLVRWPGFAVHGLEWRRAVGVADLAALGTKVPYLWYRDADGSEYVAVCGTAHPVPSQFMRRWVGERIGSSDWNWRTRRSYVLAS